MSKNTMTQSAANRIQSATAKANGGQVPANSFASRAQSATARNGANTSNIQGGKK